MELFDRRASETFGELSLLLDKQANEARAWESGLVLRIDAGAVHRELQNSPAAALALAKLVAERMTLAEARLGEVALHAVKERLRRLLEHLAVAAGVRDSRGHLLRDGLTHEELAHMVGVGRVAVTRALRQLEREGAILRAGLARA
jgi:CRP/FNR family cyclic AMP-dependent transcriptional regulator